MALGGSEARAIELDPGVYLENRGALLAWSATPEELRRLTRPDYCVARDGSAGLRTLAWKDRVLGLPCQVTASFPPGREVLCGVRLLFEYPEAIRSIPAGFACVGQQLAGRFRSPLSSREDGEQGEARWVIGGVALRHAYFVGMGGGHYLFIYPQQSAA